MFVKILLILYFSSILIYTYHYFKKSFDIKLGYFIGYLFFMLLFELTAQLVKYTLKLDNVLVYNILTFLEFNCLLLFIRGILYFMSTKKLLIGLTVAFNVIYALSTIYYIVLRNYLQIYNEIASVSGSFLVTIAIFLFFKDFINSDKISNFKKSLSFWISSGLLIYYLGTIPITSIMNYMQSINDKAEVRFLFNIQYVLVALMYSIFIFGALWSQKKEK